MTVLPSVLFLLAAAGPAKARESADTVVYGWENEFVGGINVSQTSFDNWVKGGENAWSWQVNLNARSVEHRPEYTWSNMGKFSFGLSSVGDAEARKSADELKFESVFEYYFGTYLNPYAAVTEESQITPGYDYSVEPKRKISAFFDPGYLTESVGMGYETPIPELKTRLGAAFKQTFTRRHPTPYADDPATPETETFRNEFGVESVTEFRRLIQETIIVESRLKLFANFEGIEFIDGEWDNLLAAKITDYVQMNLNVKVLYDRDVSASRQIKQLLSLGLVYSFL